MYNFRSFQAVSNARWGVWRRPETRYSFTRIPATIASMLTGEQLANVLPDDTFPVPGAQYENVILLFLDAFGWNLLNRVLEERPHAVVENLVQAAQVSMITSQFPSTTVAHVHTLASGSPASETGVWEWGYYDQTVDRVILPFPYLFVSQSGLKERPEDTLDTRGVSGSQLFPNGWLYPYLSGAGVECLEFTHLPIVEATRAGRYGAELAPYRELVPYTDLEEGLREVVRKVRRSNGPRYVKFYYDMFDRLSHLHGPDSIEVLREIEKFFDILEKTVLHSLSGRDNTVLLIAADHGQITVEPSQTVYIDTEAPELLPMLRRTHDGLPIYPCGGKRDVALHIQPHARDRAYALLQERLGGIAEVYFTEDLMREGIFGNAPSETFRDRIGDIMVLPRGEHLTWFYGIGGALSSKGHKGEHGGLDPREMDTPWIVLPLNEW